ncbi:MAG: hypothetical protein ABSA49_20300 [Rhizomicrobium sp.]|jgi:hypothetical protein
MTDSDIAAAEAATRTAEAAAAELKIAKIGTLLDRYLNDAAGNSAVSRDTETWNSLQTKMQSLKAAVAAILKE